MFDYSFHWRTAFRSLPDMLSGCWVTVQVAVLSLVLGVIIALILMVMHEGKNKVHLLMFGRPWSRHGGSTIIPPEHRPLDQLQLCAISKPLKQ